MHNNIKLLSCGSIRFYSSENIFHTKTTNEWVEALNKRRNYGVLQHLGFELETVLDDGGIKAKVCTLLDIFITFRWKLKIITWLQMDMFMLLVLVNDLANLIHIGSISR
jgi:hypothetical protein